jgi:hypothetical protein
MGAATCAQQLLLCLDSSQILLKMARREHAEEQRCQPSTKSKIDIALSQLHSSKWKRGTVAVNLSVELKTVGEGLDVPFC